MDGDDRRARATQRERVLEVGKGGTEPAEQPRDGERHAQLLATRGELDRLDALGHEVRPARDRREAELAAGEHRQPRSRFSTYVSSPVRWRPRTSASIATSGAHATASS